MNPIKNLFYICGFLVLLCSCEKNEISEAIIEDEPQLLQLPCDISISKIIEHYDFNYTNEQYEVTIKTNVIECKKQNLQYINTMHSDTTNTYFLDRYIYNTDNQLINIIDFTDYGPFETRISYDSYGVINLIKTYGNEMEINKYTIEEVEDNKYNITKYGISPESGEYFRLENLFFTFDEEENLILVERLPVSGFEGYDFTLEFVYDEKGNLISHWHNNVFIHSISYSSIKNTKSYLTLRSYGKKNYYLTLFEKMDSSSFPYQFLEAQASFNVQSNELNYNNYEIHESGYYSKRTDIEESGNLLTSTEYIFD